MVVTHVIWVMFQKFKKYIKKIFFVVRVMDTAFQCVRGSICQLELCPLILPGTKYYNHGMLNDQYSILTFFDLALSIWENIYDGLC